MPGILARVRWLEEQLRRITPIAGEGIILSRTLRGTVINSDGGANASGMFDCRLLPPDDEHPDWRVECYDSALPDYEKAGVATVNGQQFDVERKIFSLDSRVHRVELKFTAPKQGIGEEGDENYVPPEDAKCEVVLLTDKEEDEEDDPYDEEGNRFVESTPDEMYYLIALIVRDEEEDDENEDEGEEKEVSYSMDQAHTPGPIFMTWYGTCIDLLQERLQTGVPIPVPPQ